MSNTWGYLREDKNKAIKSGIDPSTGIVRTGLDEYLSVIFPDTTDWIHDKGLGPSIKSRRRPDYRSESLKLIVEFDGLQHYTNPENIKKDFEAIKFYEELGYNVVRIPYFIQLTNCAVRELFGVDVKEDLFNPNIPSLSIENKNTPAYLCIKGVERMAKEFKRFPEQFEVNKYYLLEENDEYLTGINSLIYWYKSI